MKILEVLLKEHEIEKILILRTLMQYKSLNMNEVCNYVNVKRATLRRYLSEMEEDIQELNSSLVITNDEKRNLTIECEKCMNMEAFIMKLQLLYLERSAYYHVLVYLTLHPEVYIDELSKNLSFSRSYCYHIFQKLNRIFEKNDFGIHLASDDGCIRAIGDELHIRLFFFQFMLIYHSSIRWPFPISREELQQNYPSDVRKRLAEKSDETCVRIDYLQAIATRPLQLGIHIPPPPKKLKKILQIYQKHSPLATSLAKSFFLFDTLKEEEKESILLYYAAVTRMFVPDLDIKSSQKDIGKEIMENETDEVAQLSKRFYASFIKTFDLQIEESMSTQVLFFISMFIQVGLLFQTDFLSVTGIIKDDNLDSKSQRLLDKIHNFHIQFLEENDMIRFKNNSSAAYFSFVQNALYLTIKVFKKVSFSLFVEDNQLFNGSSLIWEKIRQVYGDDLFVKTDQADQADLIITDYISRSTENSVVHFIGDLFEERTWRQILDFLNNMIVERSLQDEA
ncbi:MAG: helix-turn-helix domain-containing protein [Breznakia sp.]